MDPLHELSELFRRFPGIGPRQAKRFSHFLISQPGSYRSQLAKAILESEHKVHVCGSCFRLFPKRQQNETLCSICKSEERDQHTLLVVNRDIDLETIEKSREYQGVYFVLGGSVPLLEENYHLHIRLKELIKKVEVGQFEEIILALNLNAEGENTEQIIRRELTPLLEKTSTRLSSFGRGLSTGAELEYADAETIGFALKGRR